MAGVERFGRAGVPAPNIASQKQQMQKSPSISARGFEDGRGGEIRTPNTRIWNPLLCQLELHP